MTHNSQPIWQPISNLPMIASLLDGQLKDLTEQHNNLKEARKKPYVLDDNTVQRIIKVYSEQRGFLWVYKEQLAKWQKISSSPDQERELARLQLQLEFIDNTLTAILKIADEIKLTTIDSLLAKSDLEVGIEVVKKMNRTHK